MLNEFSRTELLLGEDSLKKLKESKVCIAGIGGVGSYVAEGLVRCGIQNFLLIDNDKVSLTNINRQIIALHSTIDKYKVDVAKARILDINPNANVEICKEFLLPENSESILSKDCTYIVDAIDTVTAKLDLIMRAQSMNIPIISCMGTGNKLNPTMLEVTDITKTSVCPLAKVMRKELKQRGVKHLKVVYSKEEPIKVTIAEEKEKKQVPGSVSFVPSVAGLIIASEVVKDIIK